MFNFDIAGITPRDISNNTGGGSSNKGDNQTRTYLESMTTTVNVEKE